VAASNNRKVAKWTTNRERDMTRSDQSFTANLNQEIRMKMRTKNTDEAMRLN
jgi:hypothetical protein